MAAAAEAWKLDGPTVVGADAGGDEARDRLLHDLADRPAAGRRRLLAEVAGTEGGIRALVDLRGRLLATDGLPSRSEVDDDLRTLLAERFAPDALRFEVFHPDTAPILLDRLTEYEAVHPIRSRADLLRRLDPIDRRCFALVHHGLPSDLVGFVEVALTQRIEWSVPAILDAPVPGPGGPPPDTAIFYSISNCQGGLRGIPTGEELLHRSIEHLRHTTTVTTFATLSPIPGFVEWLGARVPGRDPGPDDDQGLLEACARYLLTAKRDGQPLDPVGRFHLRNGARLERLNPGGDTSERGMARSRGITATYRYDPRLQADNRAAYQRGELVAAAEIRALAEVSAP